MRGSLSRRGLGYLLPITLLLGGVSCHSRGESEITKVVRPVKVARVVSRSEVVKNFSGIVEAVEYSNLAFRLGGEVIELPIVEGERVAKGDLIATLDNQELQIELTAKRAAYETATQQLERNKRLRGMEIISEQEYEISRANFEKSRAEYDIVLFNLEQCQLYAPFDGSIAKRLVEKYQQVSAGTPIVELVNTHQLEVTTTLPDNYLYLLRAQERSFEITFDNYRGRSFTGELVEYLEASPEGGGIPITLAITDPAFAAIRDNIKPGFACNVTMTTVIDEYLGSSLNWIPLTAVFTLPQSGREYVWVVGDNNRVEQRPVEVYAPSGENSLFISKGLSVGELVVTAGVYQLVEGDKVKLLNEATNR